MGKTKAAPSQTGFHPIDWQLVRDSATLYRRHPLPICTSCKIPFPPNGRDDACLHCRRTCPWCGEKWAEEDGEALCLACRKHGEMFHFKVMQTSHPGTYVYERPVPDDEGLKTLAAKRFGHQHFRSYLGGGPKTLDDNLTTMALLACWLDSKHYKTGELDYAAARERWLRKTVADVVAMLEADMGAADTTSPPATMPARQQKVDDAKSRSPGRPTGITAEVQKRWQFHVDNPDVSYSELAERWNNGRPTIDRLKGKDFENAVATAKKFESQRDSQNGGTK